MPGAATIVEREVLRGQRRWQTFAFRGGFIGAMFVLFALSYRDMTRWQDWSRPEDLAYVGSRLFEFTMYSQWWLLGLLTPILVAQGIVEEKNQGTLELLTISRITPTQLLRGKVLSSLSHLGLLLLGGLPIVALCLAFGGVSPGSIVISYLCTAVGVLTLASLSAFFALFARGPIGPLFFSWAATFWGWIVMALPGVVAADDDDALGWVSLGFVFARGIDDPELWMVWPCLVWIAMSAVILGLAGRVFSSLLVSNHGEDADGALLSVEVWAIERLKRTQALRIVILLLTSPLLGISSQAGGRHGLLLAASFLWVMAALFTSMTTILLVSRGVLLKAAAFVARRALSKSEKVAIVSGPRIRGQRPPGARQVWGNPVAWRETVTKAHGFLTTIVGRLYIAVLVMAVALLSFFPWMDDHDETFVVLTGFGFVSTAVLAVLIATSAMTGEQRRGTLALLCVTPLGGAGVLRGKLLGLLAYLGPPFAVSCLCALLATPAFGHQSYRRLLDMDAMLFRTAAIIWLAFSATLFLSSASLWIAARMRTPTRAWMATLGFTALLVFGPVMVMVMTNGHGPWADLMQLLNPMLDEGYWIGAVPGESFVSGIGWVALAMGLLMHNASTLARVAR